MKRSTILGLRWLQLYVLFSFLSSVLFPPHPAPLFAPSSETDVHGQIQSRAASIFHIMYTEDYIEKILAEPIVDCVAMGRLGTRLVTTTILDRVLISEQGYEKLLNAVTFRLAEYNPYFKRHESVRDAGIEARSVDKGLTLERPKPSKKVHSSLDSTWDVVEPQPEATTLHAGSDTSNVTPEDDYIVPPTEDSLISFGETESNVYTSRHGDPEIDLVLAKLSLAIPYLRGKVSVRAQIGRFVSLGPAPGRRTRTAAAREIGRHEGTSHFTKVLTNQFGEARELTALKINGYPLWRSKPLKTEVIHQFICTDKNARKRFALHIEHVGHGNHFSYSIHDFSKGVGLKDIVYVHSLRRN